MHIWVIRLRRSPIVPVIIIGIPCIVDHFDREDPDVSFLNTGNGLLVDILLGA
jgi:hypothetical protein